MEKLKSGLSSITSTKIKSLIYHKIILKRIQIKKSNLFVKTKLVKCMFVMAPRDLEWVPSIWTNLAIRSVNEAQSDVSTMIDG